MRLADKTVVRFEYYLIKLKHLDYRRYLASANPLSYALMAKMNYNSRQRVHFKADFLRLILGCGVDAARRSMLVAFIETYMPLRRDEEVEFQRVVVSQRKYRKVQKMITI